MTHVNSLGKTLTLLYFVLGLLNPVNARAQSMAEVLGKAHELSSRISALGGMGENKIKNPKLEEYNTQMKQNNGLTQQAISQVAKQLGVSLPAAQTDNTEEKALESLSGSAFEKSFLNKSVGLQSQLLDLVKSKLLPNLSSPMASTLLKSFTPGLAGLVEKGKTLQSLIGK